MKIGCKIESVVGVNFKKLLAKVVNLIFKYILSSYFVECGWRCSSLSNIETRIRKIEQTCKKLKRGIGVGRTNPKIFAL